MTIKTSLSKLAAGALLTASAALPLQANAFFWNWGPSTYTKTEHPIMLVQGILAFDTIAGAEYWYKVAEKLEDDGATVYTAQINAFNDSIDRGDQLIAQLENIKATTPSIEKFNLIAHSQGGLTARYVMNERPDLVASVSTAGAPHTGTPITDFLNGAFPENTFLGSVYEEIGDALGNLLDTLSGDDVDPGSVRDLTNEFTANGAAAFNAQYPLGMPAQACGQGAASVTIEGHTIPLYSWGGNDSFTNIADPADYLFKTTSFLFDGGTDGVTGQCASHFGTVIRDDYKMNHGDLINQTLGIHSLFSADPLSLYRTHANRLKNAGL